MNLITWSLPRRASERRRDGGVARDARQNLVDEELQALPADLRIEAADQGHQAEVAAELVGALGHAQAFVGRDDVEQAGALQLLEAVDPPEGRALPARLVGPVRIGFRR